MNTIVLDFGQNSNRAAGEAARLLRRGELVAFPTETVYGIGCSIYDEKAISKIYAVKSRSLGKPLSAHICSLKMAEGICRDIPDDFYLLADKLLPGPLSIVLNASDNLPRQISLLGGTVSLRYPSNRSALAMINSAARLPQVPQIFPAPLPAKTADEALGYFSGKISAVVAGGAQPLGIESTVLSLSGDKPLVLRLGAIPVDLIQDILGQRVTAAY